MKDKKEIYFQIMYYITNDYISELSNFKFGNEIL